MAGSSLRGLATGIRPTVGAALTLIVALGVLAACNSSNSDSPPSTDATFRVGVAGGGTTDTLLATAVGISSASAPEGAVARVQGGAAATGRNDSAEARCAALEALNLSETIALSAKLVTSGEAAGQTNLPEFCRVALTVSEAINIEVWLPTDTYNGRYQAVGNWGYGGSILHVLMAPALKQGYATAATDTGHAGAMPDGTFALNPDGSLNDQLIVDWASRSLIEMTLKAKALISEFYGAEPEYSYWNGCSQGGRQGMMLAQRLPDAYDGIMAGAPAISWDRLFTASWWPSVVQQNELGGPMSDCKLKGFNDAAISHCDVYDGVRDGVIGDPTRCDFDPTTLIGMDLGCGPITAAEARAVQKIWDGPVAPDGEQLWYGIAYGTPLEKDTWIKDHLGYWVQQDPEFDWRTLDYAGYAEAFRESVTKFEDVIGSDDPDLRPFQRAGGKIVMWHGQADKLFPEQSTGYYDRVVDVFHSRTHVERFMRLFMAPGVGHCGGGVGPDVIDPFGALVDWVENGRAPDTILASRIEAGEVVRTQPLCLYPKVAVYDRRGDVNQASSYRCRPNYGSSSTPNHR